METLGCIFLLLFGLRVLHLLAMSYDSVIEKSVLLSLTNAAVGGYLSWWDKRWIVIKYDYLEGKHKVYKWLVTIIGGCIVVYKVIAFVIYVLTSAWFWWTVGGIVLAGCIVLLCIHLYKKKQERIEAKELARREAMDQSCRELENKFRDLLGIPMTEHAITEENYEFCYGEFERLLKMKTDMEQSQIVSDRKNKINFINQKLLAFFRIPARSQIISIFGKEDEYLKVYENELDEVIHSGDYNKLRKPDAEDEQFDREMNDALVSYHDALQDNRMAPILKRMDYLKEKDTTNWLGFTSTSKLSEQTENLKKLYEAAQNEFKELDDIREKVMFYLSLTRVKAFENLYFGVELLNVIRDNSGGKNLTKQEDVIKFDLSSIQIDDARSGKKVSLLNISSNSVTQFFDKYENNERFARYVEANPKQAAATQLVSMGMDYFRQRMESIEQNNAVQKQIFEAIPNMVDAYSEGQANLLRAIEIIRALSEANKGFNSIYSPLFEKVFVIGKMASVTLEEMQQLVLAVSEYNKISQSKL